MQKAIGVAKTGECSNIKKIGMWETDREKKPRESSGREASSTAASLASLCEEHRAAGERG